MIKRGVEKFEAGNSRKLENIDLKMEEMDLETWTNQELLRMENGLIELGKDGAIQIEAANGSIGLSEDDLMEIRGELDISGRMTEISSRAGELFKKTKAAMAKTLAIGMASMAISGCAGKFEDGQAWLGEKVEASFSDKDLSKEDELKYGEIARQDMIEKIKSDTYLQRLTMETDGDIERAKKIQQERLKNVEEAKVEYLRDIDSLNRIHGIMENKAERRDVPRGEKVGGFAFVPANKEEPVEIGILEEEGDDNNVDHEFSHAADRYGFNIPSKTRERLKNLLFVDKTKDREVAEYCSKPTEILARKHAIDAKMKQLGIKKYEEKYTKQHFEALLRNEYARMGVENDEDLDKYIKEKKRIPEGVEFIILYGFEGIEELFNEIAENKNVADKNNSSDIV